MVHLCNRCHIVEADEETYTKTLIVWKLSSKKSPFEAQDSQRSTWT